MPGAPLLLRTLAHARHRTSLRLILSYSAWNRRPGSALAARYSACCKARTGSAGTPRPDPCAAGLALPALTGPLLNITRIGEAAALPITAGCVVLRLNRYYGRLRRPPGQRSTCRGHRLSDATLRQQNPQAAGPGRASPVPAATVDTFRAPYAGESLTAALPGSSPLPWPSPRSKGLGTSCTPPSRAGLLTTPQASRHATDRIVAPPYRAFDAGLRPGPFPDQAASLLPGLLAATRTGLPPASGDELTDTKIHHGAYVMVSPPILLGAPEGGVIAIAGIGRHHRPRAAGGGDLPQHAPPAGAGHLAGHLQRQPPLFGMPHLIGDAGPRAAATGPGRPGRVGQRLVIPGSRAEQPPVRRGRGVLVHQVHADGDLAVGDLAQRPGVLPGHARRGRPVLGEAGVIDHQRPHRLAGREPPRDIPPHGNIAPGRGGDELLQPLMVHAQPRRHRPHRLAPPIGQQPAHIQLPGRPLVLPRQPAEHLRGEIQQPGPDLRDLLRGHAGITPQNPATIPDLTKYY